MRIVLVLKIAHKNKKTTSKEMNSPAICMRPTSNKSIICSEVYWPRDQKQCDIEFQMCFSFVKLFAGITPELLASYCGDQSSVISRDRHFAEQKNELEGDGDPLNNIKLIKYCHRLQFETFSMKLKPATKTTQKNKRAYISTTTQILSTENRVCRVSKTF